MYKYHYQLLPLVFQNFFDALTSIHSYNTRQASKKSYYVPKAKTNYGIFNIRFQGPKIWNSIDESLESLVTFGVNSLPIFNRLVQYGKYFCKPANVRVCVSV